MTKSVVPNFKRWSVDERRLLVVFLLTLIYPVFVTSFFAMYVFVLMPVLVHPGVSFEEAHHEGWYHFYWLFVSCLWVILCALILPFFKEKKIQNAINLASIERSMHTQPTIKVEVENENGSQSKLSQKYENSSENIKEASDLESEKESLEKSRESLNKSPSSLDRKNLTKSGEFLNDFISIMDSEDVKNNETVCEIHNEEDKDAHYDKMNGNSDQENKELAGEQEQSNEKAIDDKTRKDSGNEETNDKEDLNTEELPDKTKQVDLNKHSDDSSDSSSCDEDAEPVILSQKAKRPHTSSPLKINEAKFEQHGDTEEPEMIDEEGKLESEVPEIRKEKARPTIDTSRISGYYECSMPTPKTADSQKPQNNTVFLFVNPETAATEDSILVSHSGEVEDSEIKESQP